MSQYHGTVTLRWGDAVERRPLSSVLSESTLADIPQLAAEEGTTPATYLMDCLLVAGFKPAAVDWRGRPGG